jgi:hypothetical protein
LAHAAKPALSASNDHHCLLGGTDCRRWYCAAVIWLARIHGSPPGDDGKSACHSITDSISIADHCTAHNGHGDTIVNRERTRPDKDYCGPSCTSGTARSGGCRSVSK